MSCPKCAEPVADAATACPRCGLARDRFDGYAAASDATASDALVALWAACEAAWDDADAHEQFVAAVEVTSSFRFAATKYRQALRERPDDPIAVERLAEVGRRAEASLLDAAAEARQKPEEGKRPYQGIIIMLALLAALIAAGVVYAVFKGTGG